MSSSRRGPPDNLDPLVDTLSNVVGILVMVVALTQIQVGDAVDRLMAVEQASEERTATTRETSHESDGLDPARVEAIASRRARVLERAGATLEESIQEAERALARVAALEPTAARPAAGESDALQRRLAQRQARLERAQAALADRERHVAALREVPRELVARLPDPELLTGREQWILCRHGRCYLADREKLLSQGEAAIGRILSHHLDARTVRPDEYETLSLYLRKKDIGDGPFVWRFVTSPDPRARLVWDSRDAGLEPSRLEGSSALRDWLARLDPSKDFIRFHVWSDSFEAYLEARRLVESADFRAGWKAYRVDQELDLPVTFGSRRPEEKPVAVD